MEMQNISPIIHTQRPIVLVGGGWVDAEILAEYAASSFIVALDGGADTLKDLGYRPNVIIGDMDSLQNRSDWTVSVHQLDDQDSTDFDKALRNIDAPLIVAFGVLGDRMDHGLASLHSLTRHDMGQKTLLIGREEAILYIAATDFECALPIATRVSLWCMQTIDFVGSAGLHYSLDGLSLGSKGLQGTSNITTECQVRIKKKTQHLGYHLMLPVQCHQILRKKIF